MFVHGPDKYTYMYVYDRSRVVLRERTNELRKAAMYFAFTFARARLHIFTIELGSQLDRQLIDDVKERRESRGETAA